jgi:hypothetical protein
MEFRYRNAMAREFFMKSNSRINRVVLIVCALTLEGNLGLHGAQATERMGTSTWDVGQVPLRVSEANHQLIGVYGDVRVRGNKTAIISDRTHPEEILKVAIQGLDLQERRRLNRQCTLRACSEIFLGFVVQGRLQAIRSYPYRSTKRPVVPPDPPLLLLSKFSEQRWLCVGARRCT